MSIQLHIQVGSNKVVISAENERDLIKQASFFGQLPCQCGNCESPDIGFVHTSPQGYDFYMLRCKNCDWEYKFGIRKEDHNLFPKPDPNGKKGWSEPYSQSGQQERTEDAPRQKTGPPPPKPKWPKKPMVDDEDNLPY